MMRKMKKLFLSVIAFISILSIGCSNDDIHTRLSGKWESVSQPMGMKGVLIFEDTTVTMQRVNSLNSSYSFSDNTLITTTLIPERDLHIIDTAQVDFNADTLTMKRKIGPEEYRLTRLTRLDNNGSGNKILGTWRWYDDHGNPGIIRYDINNSVYAEITTEDRKGVFQIREDKITMVFPGTTFHDLKYRFDKDTLFIESSDGKNEYAHLKVNN
jgi:hypothetical protein